MTLCAGIAIHALCIPLPGIPAGSLAEAGWPTFNDQPGDRSWFGHMWLTANQYRVLVGVMGDSDTLDFVTIRESSNQKSETVSRMQVILRGSCSNLDTHPIWTCRFRKRSYDATRCAGGWLLAKHRALQRDRSKVLAVCKKLERLFMELESSGAGRIP
jgi:hypothetical protein